MEEVLVRMNENGRVVIPASFRKKLGISSGDEMILRVEDDELRITSLKQRVARAQARMGRYIGRGARLSEELIAERREAAKHE